MSKIVEAESFLKKNCYYFFQEVQMSNATKVYSLKIAFSYFPGCQFFSNQIQATVLENLADVLINIRKIRKEQQQPIHEPPVRPPS